MNKCPQCLNILSVSIEVCPKCSFSLLEDKTRTLGSQDVDKTQSTKILSDEKMTPEKWQKIKQLFDAAQEISPKKRERFLQNACGDDSELKSEVEKLLGSFENAESFLESPVVGEVATLFEEKKTRIGQKTTGEIKSGNFVAGTILAGRYRIIGLLGKGGMGKVYRAEDLKLNQIVALKFLSEKLEENEDALKRFIGEVRTARQVSHPNVCKVFDIGDINGKHFLSMEFIDGDDLSQLLRRIGRLPSDKAVEISRQICFGLHAIHDAGILHRDLKPANVIIDSNGKARITDFGIAGIEADISKKEISIGTPAYMSPEQITGREVTTKSDIYSLGLLLYEIFTGKQAFEGESLDELIKKHQTTQPTNPSEFVENIEPIVEKTINRCLEKDPKDRPTSALQVALSLPGGNPLEAAIAAGETPSPEMVAAAPKKGALKPKIALGLLFAFFAVFILLSVNQHFNKTFNIAPPQKPKEVLAEKSREIVQKFGYADSSAKSVYGFQDNEDYMDFAYPRLMNNEMSVAEVKKSLASGRALLSNFLYRQSPEYLKPNKTDKITDSDPPFNVPNMVNVKLDSNGRLIEFVAVPPKVSEQTEKRETDWNSLFAESGLDISKFKQIENNQTPPVFADERIAWQGSFDELPEVPIRIEAASLNGKPVFFQILATWNEKAVETQRSENIFRKIGVILMILIHFSVILGSIWLARRNLKVGRGDLRGGLKLMIFLFLLLFTGRFVYSDHVPTVWGELTILYGVFAKSLIVSLFIGLIYIALEPFVRRYWSELLISWNRLLKGDLRDPLVGRDVLVGLILGMGHTFGILFGSFLQSWATNNEGILNGFYLFEPINGFAGTVYGLASYPVSSISTGFISLFLLLGFYILTKKKNLSIFLLFFIMFALQGLIFVLTQHWAYFFSAIINAFCMCFALYRFGLVGVIAFWLGFYLSYDASLTFSTSSLYFPNTVITFFFTFALAVCAFYISIAEQPIFGGDLLKDIEE